MSQNYIEKILRAKVYDVAVETPLNFVPSLSERLANRVFLKREDLQSRLSISLNNNFESVRIFYTCFLQKYPQKVILNWRTHLKTPPRSHGISS